MAKKKHKPKLDPSTASNDIKADGPVYAFQIAAIFNPVRLWFAAAALTAAGGAYVYNSTINQEDVTTQEIHQNNTFQINSSSKGTCKKGKQGTCTNICHFIPPARIKLQDSEDQVKQGIYFVMNAYK